MSPFPGLESVRSAPVARLATVRPDGRPHVVPIVFAIVEDHTLVFAVDGKPKRTLQLQRLRNIAVQPAVSILVDHYAADWAALWWVRVDGIAAEVADEARRAVYVAALAAKYSQYRTEPPRDAVVAVSISVTTAWAADGRALP
ncbi:MAG: TIGR03668 family PPOX class F420-dependent oxidoreductase [Jatrophihabitans sp.]|uniref:TIGR03668 family PPOX class F420-dependent oxidoreductase n=1 Tax=Jatrophihabitans sp. TaxID=1932789 RepID=UPI00390FED39